MRNIDVFRPGDLVHTTSINRFADVCKDGIRTGRAVFGEEGSPTPDDICFAMLPNLPSSERYLKTGHLGPRQTPQDLVAIIVSTREVMQKDQTGRLVAVGTRFWKENSRQLAKRLYDMSPDNTRVNGIEIKSEIDSQYPDQVRFWSSQPLVTRITPDYWEGVVVQQDRYDQLREVLMKNGVTIDLPIMAPTGQLLAESVGYQSHDRASRSLILSG